MRNGSRSLALCVALAAVLGAGACAPKADSLLLVDLRSSGPFVGPVASLRLSVPDHASWAAFTVNGALTTSGMRVGYYVPGGAGAVTVQAAALDASGCVLGQGATTFPTTTSGAVSAEMILYVRPLAASGCMTTPDAGADAPDDTAADAGIFIDAGGDGADAGVDAGGADAGGDGANATGDGQAADSTG